MTGVQTCALPIWAFGLTHRYDSARLLIGRSLAEPEPPDPLPSGTKFFKTTLSGELLFGNELDLWLCTLILDGKFNPSSSTDDFRTLLEAHWARGFTLLREELELSGNNEIKLVARLAELLPEGAETAGVSFGLAGADTGEIRLRVGSVSQTHPGGKPVDFVLNGQSTAPHIA